MMHLLLDKSTLQSLSPIESIRISDHYYSVYAPTLFVEIMGDLKKVDTDEDRKRQIAYSARKISGFESAISANYRILIRAELSGHAIEMKGRPIVLGGERIPDPDGVGFGMFYDEEPEHGIMRKWLQGDWSKAELEMAENYRRSTTALDLSWLTRLGFTPPDSRTLNSLDKFVKSISITLRFQESLLRFLLIESDIAISAIDTFVARWKSFGSPNLAIYAPYSLHCIRVLLFFYLGVAARLLGTRPTNRVDAEYLFYVPFTRVFSSSDNFLREMAPFFLNNRQDFVWGMDFKKAIKQYVEHYKALGSDRVNAFREKFGVYPLLDPPHITTVLHERYFGPLRERPPRPPQTPEQEAQELANVRELIARIERSRRGRTGDNSS